MSKPNRLQVEQEHHKQAYEMYYGLGAKRTYRDVGERVGVSASAVKLMARSFNWSTRIQERDAAVARQAADQVIGSAVADAARKRKIVEMALVRVAKAIASGQARIQVADLDRLIRLQAFLGGEGASCSVAGLLAMRADEQALFFHQFFESLSTAELDDLNRAGEALEKSRGLTPNPPAGPRLPTPDPS